MSMLEHSLISKILDSNSFFEVKKYNITSNDFVALKPVYEFIEAYAKSNKGNTPDYRTVVDKFEDFDYLPEVADSFEYMSNELKANSAKRSIYEVLQKQLPENFNNMNGAEFVEWGLAEFQRVKELSNAVSKQGTNYATNGDERLEWYNNSKENRTNIFVPTPYDTMNEWLAGGGELGDYLLIMAYTNRGKSWIASDFGISAWRHGFGVLHYSPELSKIQQMNRLDTLVGHFNNVELRIGQLGNEAEYEQYLGLFKEEEGIEPYIVKTMEDLDNGLNIDTIEADLASNPQLKVCIIDGFNLMTHNGKDGNRNNMSNTSRRLRQLFAKYKVLGIVVHQTNTGSEKDSKQMDEVGNRVVSPPKLESYSETVAVIQDACTILTFDQSEGLGKLQVVKARVPCVGKVLDLLCNFNFGYITEMKAEEDSDLPF